MLNYIKSEFYQIRHNKSLLWAGGIMALLIIAVAGFIKYFSSRFGADMTTFSPLYTSMSLIFAVAGIFASFLENGEHMRHHTLKNSVAFGIHRSKIYIGKFVSQFITCTFMYLFLAAFYIAVTCVVLGVPSGSEFISLFRALAGGYPLCICCFSISMCFFTNMGSGAGGLWSAIGVVYVLPNVFSVLSIRFSIFDVLYKWSPVNMISFQLDGIKRFAFWDTASGMAHCYLTGIVGTVMFLIIGMYWLERREIR